jgi:Tol biopolymer transport system component
LADGGVGYTDTGNYLAPATVAALEAFRTRIIDGTISVDATPATEPPSVKPDAFVFDLRTGERSPLPDGLAGGGDYVASPDGTRVARSTCCGPQDAITIANIDGSDLRTLQSPAGVNYYSPQWSPDGTKLIYQQRDASDPGGTGDLFIEDLATGQRTQVTQFERTAGWWWWIAPNFSPDGSEVIFHVPREPTENTEWDVWTVPVTGGEPTLVLDHAVLPAYLPDGEIMFVEPSPGLLQYSGIQIADTNGDRRTLFESDKDISWPTASPDGTRIAYQQGGTIFVLDVGTGESTEAVPGLAAEWLTDDSLIVMA